MSKDKQPKDPAEQGKEIKTAADLIQDEHNYRKHSETNKARIRKSIDEAGLGRSVVIDADGVLVAGNGVQQVIDKDTPVRVVETDGTELVVVKRTDLHTGDPRRKTLALADNATADDVEWDFEAIADDWTEDEAGEWGVEWPEDEEEIEQKEAQEDDFDHDKPVETVCKKGDIWKLGNHRLMCGDSTDAGDVALLMNGEKADLCLTDPPYGIKRDKGFEGFGGFGPPIARRQYNDDWDSFTPSKECFDLMLQQANKAVVFGGNFFTDKLPQGNHWLVWNKHNTMPTFGDAELAWTNIDRNSVKIFDIQYNGLLGKEKERFHPTQKPVKLFSEILSEYTKDGNLVLDLFGGSGTTLIAAEQLNRKCYMMELDPHYCDVIIARWEKLTGNKAEKLK